MTEGLLEELAAKMMQRGAWAAPLELCNAWEAITETSDADMAEWLEIAESPKNDAVLGAKLRNRLNDYWREMALAKVEHDGLPPDECAGRRKPVHCARALAED